MEDLASRVGEEDIVRNDNGRSAAWFERCHDVLNEVELLVARGDDEVVSVRCLVGASRAKGRVRKDDVKALPTGCFVDRVAKADLGLDLVEVEIHERETS